MKLTIEVKEPQGNVREGVSNGRSWKMAEQLCVVTLSTSPYPITGKRDIYVPRDRATGVLGDPEWMSPGTYEADLVIKTDKYGRLAALIDWRNMTPVRSSEAAPPKLATAK